MQKHAESLLPHDQDGRLLPLECPIECFTVFGAGVYAYMRWTVLMKRVFFVCFLFSLSNMVNNIFGGEVGASRRRREPPATRPLGLCRLSGVPSSCVPRRAQLGPEKSSWLSMPTIGNAKTLNASYGASEVLVVGVLLWGMFAAVRIVRKEEACVPRQRRNPPPEQQSARAQAWISRDAPPSTHPSAHPSTHPSAQPSAQPSVPRPPPLAPARRRVVTSRSQAAAAAPYCR
jgi:hypothetical protein